jgi:hypothetical protein
VKTLTASTCACLVLFVAARPCSADVVIVDNGQPRAAIFVPARLLDDAGVNPEPASVWRTLSPRTTGAACASRCGT